MLHDDPLFTYLSTTFAEENSKSNAHYADVYSKMRTN